MTDITPTPTKARRREALRLLLVILVPGLPTVFLLLQVFKASSWWWVSEHAGILAGACLWPWMYVALRRAQARAPKRGCVDVE